MYQLFGKRTLPPMAVFGGTVFVALVCTIIFYKELTNKALSDKTKAAVTIEATNKVYLGKWEL